MENTIVSKTTPEEISCWVAEAQQGNIRAFELLYREYCGKLLLFCRRLTSDVSASEELVQESFIKAWSALAEFRSDSQFYTWLRKIASRLVIDRFRLKQEKIWQNAAEFNEQEFSKRCNAEPMIDLERLMSLLPQGARSIFILNEIEGYTHKEIAALLDIAEGTSKAQLARAKHLLRVGLSQDVTANEYSSSK